MLDVATLSSRCRDIVATLSSLCRDIVATLYCCFSTAVLLGFFTQVSFLSSKGTRDLEVGEFRVIKLQNKKGTMSVLLSRGSR